MTEVAAPVTDESRPSLAPELTGLTAPAWTLQIGPPDPPPYVPSRMSPFALQSPVQNSAPAGRFASVSGGPPVTSIFLTVLTLPVAMNPRYRPSGDQKGLKARSVPGRRRHSRLSKSRSHNPPDVSASLRPSGETDIESPGLTFSGTATSNRLSAPGSVGRNSQLPIPNATTAVTVNAASPCHTRTDRVRVG